MLVPYRTVPARYRTVPLPIICSKLFVQYFLFYSTINVAKKKHQNISPIEMFMTTGYGNVSVDIIGDSFVDLFCFLDEALPEEGGDARLQHPIR